MPVRRSVSKRRSTEGLAEWEFVFSSGYDYFRELTEIGIALDEYGRPAAEVAKAAWRRLGNAFLAKPRHPEQGTPWALEQFGYPSGKRRR